MTKIYSFFLIILCLNVHSLSSQDVYQRNQSADVQSYIFSLSLNDDNNKIVGESSITVSFKNDVEQFSLDFIAKSGEYGMKVTGGLRGQCPGRL